MRLNLKLRLLAFGIFVVTPVLYATGSNKAKSGNFLSVQNCIIETFSTVIFMKMFVNVISGLKCNMDRW